MDQKTAPQPSAYQTPEARTRWIIEAFARGEISAREALDYFPRSLPPYLTQTEPSGRPQ